MPAAAWVPPTGLLKSSRPVTLGTIPKIKFDLYEENGVREYWIVAPGINTVTVYVLEGAEYRIQAEYAEPGPMPVTTLPGLAVEWADVFDDE